MTTLLRKLPIFAFMALLSFATFGCELEGGEGDADATTGVYPTQITLQVYGDNFNTTAGAEVSSIDLAVNGTVRFEAPAAGNTVNIVISQLGVDQRVTAGTAYTQTFNTIGSYTVTDENSGAVPKPSVIVNVR